MKKEYDVSEKELHAKTEKKVRACISLTEDIST